MPLSPSLLDLMKRVTQSTPFHNSTQENSRLLQLWNNHKAMERDAVRRLTRQQLLGGETNKDQMAHSMIRANISSARSAKKYGDSQLRFLELPNDLAPDQKLAASATVYPPGYFRGDPHKENSLYIQGIGSVEPGAGRGILERLKELYPDNPWFLESLEDHGTPEYYVKRGFNYIDQDDPRGLQSEMPNFYLPEGRLLKAEGGVISQSEANQELLKGATGALTRFGKSLPSAVKDWPKQAWDMVRFPADLFLGSPEENLLRERGSASLSELPSTPELRTRPGSPERRAHQMMSFVNPIANAVFMPKQALQMANSPLGQATLGGLGALAFGVSPATPLVVGAILPQKVLKAIKSLAKSPEDESLAISRLTGLAKQADLSVYSPTALARSALGLPAGQHGFSEAVETIIPPFGTSMFSPTDFLDKFIPMNSSKDDQVVEGLIKSIKDRKLINLPVVGIEPGPIAIQSGRHRMAALKEIQGETPVPTNLINTSRLWEDPPSSPNIGSLIGGEVPTTGGKSIPLKPHWVNPDNFNKGGPVKFGIGGSVAGALKNLTRRTMPQFMEGAAHTPAPAGALSVIKNKGGNWLTGSVEDALRGLKKPNPTPIFSGGPEGRAEQAAWDAAHPMPPVNSWIDRNLTKYVKNEMATPEDPVRAFAEAWPAKKSGLQAAAQAKLDGIRAKIHQKAQERGVPEEYMTRLRQEEIAAEKAKKLVDLQEGLHYQPTPAADFAPMSLSVERSRQGFPPHGMGIQPGARAWEKASDRSVVPVTAKDWSAAERDATFGGKSVDPETKGYQLGAYNSQELGFPHLTDELSNAINPASGLPPHLQFEAANLGKVSVPQAVERVAQINAWRAAQKIEANKALANNPATHVYKDYPESDYHWVELKKPDGMWGGGDALPDGVSIGKSNKGKFIASHSGRLESSGSHETAAEAVNTLLGKRYLQDALKYEGDTMAHCVGSYCPDVAEGKTRILSLRNKKTGQPHVTVEVGKGFNFDDPFFDGRRTRQLRDFLSEHSELTPEEQKLYLGGFKENLRGNPGFMGADRVIQNRFPGIKPSPELAAKTGELYNSLMGKYKEVNPPLPRITQIKRHGNKVGPDDYEQRQYVQDLVKSQQWADVGDLQNAGLLDIQKEFKGAPYLEELQRAFPDQKYITDQEYNAWKNKPGEDFASGGFVDRLRQAFAEGGIVAQPSFEDRLREAFA